MKSKPRTHFYYSNACTYILGRVVEKVTGKNVRDFLVPLLFEPLKILILNGIAALWGTRCAPPDSS